jgi:imidazolonepropionase-like amidohydrolase
MSLSLLLFQTVAITGGTIHTLEPGAAPFTGTVLIENSYVSAVGPKVEVPAGAQTFDATGKHVIPGLIDAFVNLDPDHDALYLSAGVTLVRDTGNEYTRILAECDRNLRDRTPGPSIWAAGAVLDGHPAATRAAAIIDTPADAERHLPVMFQDGVSFLSFHSHLAVEPWKKVLELAHQNQRQVWGPRPAGASLDDVLAAGQDGVYHLDAFLPDGVTWEKLTPEAAKAIAARAGAKKLAVTPTLAVYAKRLVKPKNIDATLAYLSPFYAETWKRDLEMRAKLATIEHLEAGAATVKSQKLLVSELIAAGCRIVPGSGAPNPWLFPGEALFDELALLRAAGVAPAELVRMATYGAAEAIGADKHGSIKPGKLGDLVITAQDPTADLANLLKPAAVVVRGQLLDRAALDKRVEALVATQNRVRETLAKPLPVAEPEIPKGEVILTGAVETMSIGTRISAEKYAVVRRYDGSLTYCGRVVIPGEATTYSTETVVQQTLKNGELTEFDVKITSGLNVFKVKGTLVAGKMSIERHQNDNFLGTDHVLDRLAFVDCGSVTGQLILGYHRAPGQFKVLEFVDYEPAVVFWEMRLDRNGLHLVVSQLSGEKRVAYDAFGGILESKRQIGSSIVQTKPTAETKAIDGKGLPMPASKRDAVPAPVPAGQPKDKPPGPPKGG